MFCFSIILYFCSPLVFQIDLILEDSIQRPRIQFTIPSTYPEGNDSPILEILTTQLNHDQIAQITNELSPFHNNEPILFNWIEELREKLAEAMPNKCEEKQNFENSSSSPLPSSNNEQSNLTLIYIYIWGYFNFHQTKKKKLLMLFVLKI